MMYRVVFMGTPEFSVPILDALINESNVDVIAVVTQPDRKVGRKKLVTPPPVKKKALDYDIPVFQPEKLSGSQEMKDILALNPDLLVTAAYGQYVPTTLLNAPRFKAINVHASLLPKYRGAAPIHYALINGEKETGVTIMYMVKQMDAGDIISQRTLPIEEDDNVGTLFEKLSLLGRDLLIDTLPGLFEGTITPIKQNEADVTLSPMIKPEEEQIQWDKQATVIANQIRGMNPFPGAYTTLNGERFKLWEAKVTEQKTDELPGTIIQLDKKNLVVACGNGTALSLKVVQPFGKAKMPVETFLSGALNYLEEGMHFAESSE